MVETETKADTGKFSFIGGQLCLDFTNTMSEYEPLPRNDQLVEYRDLIIWGQEADVITGEEAQRLLREAERRPEESTAILDEARALRGAIHNIFAALAVESALASEDIATLN